MSELESLLVKRDEQIPLDVALLQMASLERPNLDVAYFVELLDSFARELEEKTGSDLHGEEWIAAMNEHLYDNLGFYGNNDDYFSTRNKYLNDVIMERTGIPIMLCVVYIEIARRVGRTIRGVDLPGQFIAYYEDRGFSAYIDCAEGGQILGPEECRELAAQVAGVDVVANPEGMMPVSNWYIVVRVLKNLRVTYYEKKDWVKLIRVLDLLLTAMPEAADEYKQRGGLYLRCRRPVEALKDFRKYLELAPQAPDFAEIQSHCSILRRYLKS